MKRTLIVLLLILFATHLSFGQKSEEKLVRKSFDNYKSAILNGRGEEALMYVDSRTLKYYEDILEQIIHADSAKIESVSFLDKILILSVRHRTSKEEILSFNGRTLFINAIETGMIGKNSVSNSEIGDVSVDKEFAKGQFVSKGKAVPFYFHFYKEDGKWKVDLTSVFFLGEIAFKKMLEDSEESENEFIFSILKLLTGKMPDNQIWQPLR